MFEVGEAVAVADVVGANVCKEVGGTVVVVTAVLVDVVAAG